MTHTRTAKLRKAALATIALLAERFPAAFAVLETKRRPLKTGIAEDILAAAPDLDKAAVGAALRFYCGNPRYRGALTAGAVRVDLAGNPTAPAVTAEEAAHAQQCLAERKARAKAKAARPAAAKPAKPKPKGPTPAPKPEAIRMSLGALREAARRRAAGNISTPPPPTKEGLQNG
jgi:ProP effector